MAVRVPLAWARFSGLVLASGAITCVLVSCSASRPYPSPTAANTPSNPPGSMVDARTVEAISTRAALVQAANTAQANAAAIAVETEAAEGGVDRSGWHTYRDDRAHFALEYPGTLEAAPGGGVLIELLPHRGGWLNIITTSGGPGTCVAPRYEQVTHAAFAPQNVTIHGVSFLRFADYFAAAGTLDAWQDYWASRGDACVILDFNLYSVSASAHASTPPNFDGSEGRAFSEILATFRWLTP